MKKVTKIGNYDEIFLNNISRDTAIMLVDIMEIRKQHDIASSIIKELISSIPTQANKLLRKNKT